MVAHVAAPGRIVLETPDAIQERVWAAAPAREQADIADDLRALQGEDNRLADAADERRARVSADRDADTDEQGEWLLRELGLWPSRGELCSTPPRCSPGRSASEGVQRSAGSCRTR